MPRSARAAKSHANIRLARSPSVKKAAPSEAQSRGKKRDIEQAKDSAAKRNEISSTDSPPLIFSVERMLESPIPSPVPVISSLARDDSDDEETSSLFSSTFSFTPTPPPSPRIAPPLASDVFPLPQTTTAPLASRGGDEIEPEIDLESSESATSDSSSSSVDNTDTPRLVPLVELIRQVKQSPASAPTTSATRPSAVPTPLRRPALLPEPLASARLEDEHRQNYKIIYIAELRKYIEKHISRSILRRSKWSTQTTRRTIKAAESITYGVVDMTEAYAALAYRKIPMRGWPAQLCHDLTRLRKLRFYETKSIDYGQMCDVCQRPVNTGTRFFVVLTDEKEDRPCSDSISLFCHDDCCTNVNNYHAMTCIGTDIRNAFSEFFYPFMLARNANHSEDKIALKMYRFLRRNDVIETCFQSLRQMLLDVAAMPDSVE